MKRPSHLKVELPDLGLGDVPILAGVWFVQPGGTVIVGDRLLEVVAGSASVDLPAPATGVLARMLVREGDRLTLGQPLAVIECEEADEE